MASRRPVEVDASGTVNASLGHGSRHAASSSGSQVSASVSGARDVEVLVDAAVAGALLLVNGDPVVPLHAPTSAASSAATRTTGGNLWRRMDIRCHTTRAIRGSLPDIR